MARIRVRSPFDLFMCETGELQSWSTFTAEYVLGLCDRSLDRIKASRQESDRRYVENNRRRKKSFLGIRYGPRETFEEAKARFDSWVANKIPFGNPYWQEYPDVSSSCRQEGRVKTIKSLAQASLKESPSALCHLTACDHSDL